MTELLTADPLGALTAIFTGLLFMVTGALALANWRAATAASQSADVLTKEFRVARLPRVRLTWDVQPSPMGGIQFTGTIQETRGIPVVVQAAYTLFEAHGRPDCWVPHLTPCGNTLYGAETRRHISWRVGDVTLPVGDLVIGAIRTKIVVSPLNAEDTRDEWEISWAVAHHEGGSFETLNMLLDIRDVSLEPLGTMRRAILWWAATLEEWKNGMKQDC